MTSLSRITLSRAERGHAAAERRTVARWFSPELKLLLCCARRDVASEAQSQIHTLLEVGIDWPTALDLSDRHGLTPFLWWHLGERFAEAIPQNILTSLETAFLTNARHNLKLTHEIHKVIRVLESRSVQVVPLKGPLLSAQLYGNLALRQSTDIDLLIGRADVTKAAELMLAAGYSCTVHLRGAKQNLYVKHLCELEFRTADGLAVELHWDIVPRYCSLQLDFDRYWREWGDTNVPANRINSLAPEALFLLLCAHAAKHRWNRLLWLADINAFLQQQSEPEFLELVLHDARKIGAERLVLVTLSLTHLLLGTSLPEALAARLREDTRVCAISRQISGDLVRLFEPGKIALHYSFLEIRERWLDRLRYVWRFWMCPGQGELAAVCLPEVFYPIARFVRGFLKALQIFVCPSQGSADRAHSS